MSGELASSQVTHFLQATVDMVNPAKTVNSTSLDFMVNKIGSLQYYEIHHNVNYGFYVIPCSSLNWSEVLLLPS